MGPPASATCSARWDGNGRRVPDRLSWVEAEGADLVKMFTANTGRKLKEGLSAAGGDFGAFRTRPALV